MYKQHTDPTTPTHPTIQQPNHPPTHTHLDVLFEVALEAAVQDLALTRLETVNHRGDGALQVSTAEQNQLLLLFCYFVTSERVSEQVWKHECVSERIRRPSATGRHG